MKKIKEDMNLEDKDKEAQVSRFVIIQVLLYIDDNRQENNL